MAVSATTATSVHSPSTTPEPWKYFLTAFVSTGLIFVFSCVMAVIASSRGEIAASNFADTALIYNGELRQEAPSVGRASEDSALTKSFNFKTPAEAREKLTTFAQAANITSTDAKVDVTADFVKKGLEYQPTFRTQFKSLYKLANTSDTQTLVTFEFPFPFNSTNSELSDVRLLVNGERVPNPKARVRDTRNGTTEGLRWEAKLEPKQQVDVQVSYETVGLARFAYQGFSNTKDSQDFKLDLTINGTRAYNVNSGLTVDKRDFGAGQVHLVWDKQDLFSTPTVDVSVADKLSPSTQVSRIYLVMAPIYAIFSAVLIWAGYRARKHLKIQDLLIATVLFTLYFPFVHYLASFTVDPTMEVFAGLSTVGNFSLSLYSAFAIALALIGGLTTYLFARAYSRKFSFTRVVPAVLLFLGFFPLVITVPEYSILLTLFGGLMLIALYIQSRLQTQGGSAA